MSEIHFVALFLFVFWYAENLLYKVIDLLKERKQRITYNNIINTLEYYAFMGCLPLDLQSHCVSPKLYFTL